MKIEELFMFAVLSYVVGSVPFGYWIGKRVKGPSFDIRDHGSCSIGFTNVLRVLGWKVAAPVLLADIAKGYLPTILGSMAGGPVVGGLCLLAAMVGHAQSIYFRLTEGVFSGGKSVSTLLGGILALQPAIAGISLGVFMLLVLFTRIVSVGSMLASLTAYLLTYAYGLGAGWNIVFASAALLVLFTHRRNIGRLMMGIEPKIGHRSEGKEIVSAFALHPLNMDDFSQMRLTGWLKKLLDNGIISERTIRKLIAMGPVLEGGQITEIVTKDGRKGRVLIFVIPFLPDQISNEANKPLLDALLKSAAIQAQRRGASVLTLGALLSSYAGGGVDLQSWCKERGLTIVIDNGAAMTIAATLEAIRNSSPIPLSEAKVGIVGARGLIGHGICRELDEKALEVIPVARRGQQGERGSTEKILDISALQNADIVVCATSADYAIITAENAGLMAQVQLVVDVAVPPDVADDAFKDRPEVTVIRSGLMTLPGKYQNDIDFHFGETKTDHGVAYLLPACLAQSFILAATGNFEQASRGARISRENVAFFTQAYEQLGLQIIASKLSEPTIYSAIA